MERTTWTAVALVVGVATLILLSRMFVDGTTPNLNGATRVGIGNNTLQLSEGTYELWYQTGAHPDERTDLDDFEFRITQADGTSVQVDAVRRVGRIGQDSNYVVFSIGQFDLDAAGEISLSVRVVGAIEDGELFVV